MRLRHPGFVLGAPAEDADAGQHPTLRTRPVVAAVLARLLPRLTEATFIPGALLVIGLRWWGFGVAIVIVLAWTYGAILHRALAGRAVSGLLILTAVGLTVRTTVSLWSASTVVYFMQPIATTVVIALVLFGSLASDQPLAGRLANDFCPLGPGVAVRPRVARLFRQLTILWAVVLTVKAALTSAMLLVLPLGVFVASKDVINASVTAVGVALTVRWSLRTARAEGLAMTAHVRSA